MREEALGMSMTFFFIISCDVLNAVIHVMYIFTKTCFFIFDLLFSGTALDLTWPGTEMLGNTEDI